MESSSCDPLQSFIAVPTGYDAVVGMRFLSASGCLVEAELEVESRHLQIHGMVHGGVYSTLVETTCSVGATLGGIDGYKAVGVENHTSFLGSAGHGDRLLVAARPLLNSTRSPLWEATITNSRSSSIVARGQVRFLRLAAAQSPVSGEVDSSS